MMVIHSKLLLFPEAVAQKTQLISGQGGPLLTFQCDPEKMSLGVGPNHLSGGPHEESLVPVSGYCRRTERCGL